MVIAVLATHANFDFVVAGFPRSFQEVLREQLTLLVEVIAGPLSIHIHIHGNFSNAKGDKIGRNARSQPIYALAP